MNAQPQFVPLAEIQNSPPRVEDPPILTGTAQFIADIVPANSLHAVFIRSPIARGRIKRVDTQAAEAEDQVRLVLTGRSGVPKGWPEVSPVLENVRHIERALISADRVDAVGEVVALVVADTELAARDAAESIVVEFESEAALPDVESAATGAPIFSDWPDNIAFEHRWLHGNSDAAFKSAAYVVSMELDMPRVAAVALETRGAVAAWDAASQSLTAWLPTQTPHRARAELSRILGLHHDRVRVITPCVGGAFGAKASIYPEDLLVAIAAMKLSCPVRWIASRNEDFVATSHGRGASLRAEAAVDAAGRFLGLRANLTFPIGSWATYSACVPAWNAGRILPGPYRVGALDVRVCGVMTNTAPIGILRGAGRPEAALVLERLMDEAAAVLQMDPVAIRRLNLISRFTSPQATPTGQTLDSGDYERLLERAVEISAYRQRVRQNDELVGVGICLYVEPCGRGWESARISREPNGRFLLACGTSAQGQGHRTTFAQIACDCLGIPLSQIDVIEGDTAQTPAGIGALASRSIAIGGSAVRLAAEQLRDNLRAISTSQSCPVAEVVYTAPAEAWSSGCCIAIVAIDRETGSLKVRNLFCVDDCGVVINPTLFKGQFVGGLAQGVGQAVYERIVYDEEGQLLTGSLMDYALLHADDMPEIEIDSIATATSANHLGAKGVGEAGCVAAPAAILNAAHNALRSFGRVRLSLPLTSESIWRVLQGSAAAPQNS